MRAISGIGSTAEIEQVDRTDVTPPPSENIIDMESATTEQASTGHVEGITGPAGLPSSRHNIKPATVAEAVGPTITREKGRTSELITSNESGRINSIHAMPEPPQPQKALPPIITDIARFATDRQRLESVREPLPQQLNRSVAEVLRSPIRDDGSLPATLDIPLANSVLQSRPHYPVQQSQTIPRRISSREPQDQNPYMYRADEIGPTHRIPGVGHLGDFLVPAGWKEGDEPIDPCQAKVVYDAARADAKQALTTSVEEMESLTNEERAEFSVEAELKWNKQFKLDDLVYKERVKVYETYHQRQQAKLQEASTLPRLSVWQPTYPPNPLHPPTTTSMFKYMPSMTPHSPATQDTTPKYNGSVPRIYDAQEGVGVGQLPRQHSSLFEPRNVPQSAYVNAEDYAIQQARLLRQSNQTSDHLSNFLAQLSPTLIQELTSAIIRSPIFGQQAGHFWNTQTMSTIPEVAGKLNLPKPQPNLSTTEGRPVGFGSFTPHTSRTSGRSHHSVIPIHRSGTTEVHRGRRLDENTQFRQNALNLGGTIGDDSVGITSEQTIPTNTSKKAGKARAKPEKPKVWYHEELASANLPTSTISKDAMQASLNHAKNGKEPRMSETQAPNVAKSRRRRKEAVDPVVGISVSRAAARMLIARGARDSMNLSNSAFLNNDAPSLLNTSQPAVQGSKAAGATHHSPYLSNPPAGQASSIPAKAVLAVNRGLAPDRAATASRGAVLQKFRPNVPIDSAVREDREESLSSPEKDDPKDINFSTKSQRSKAPSSARKRKSVGPVKASKRSRVSLDGAEEDDVDHEQTCSSHNTIDLTTPRERAARPMLLSEDYDNSPLSARSKK